MPLRSGSALRWSPAATWAFQFGPDGQRVLFRAEQDEPGVAELYGIALP